MEVGARWIAKNPGTRLISIKDAFELGKRRNQGQFKEALEIAAPKYSVNCTVEGGIDFHVHPERVSDEKASELTRPFQKNASPGSPGTCSLLRRNSSVASRRFGDNHGLGGIYE